MAIIQLNSKDPNLSYVINKNPSSGQQIKSVRLGHSHGWFSNDNTSYNILFRDHETKVSFGDDDVDYMDRTRYCSGRFVLSAISDFFATPLKKQCDIDPDGIEKDLFINMIHVSNMSQLTNFSKYFTDFELEFDPDSSKVFTLRIKTTKSFHLLFNYVNVLMLFLTLVNKDEYMFIDDNVVDKYLTSIERLDAPFFIRYLFSRNVFRRKKQFQNYKSRLETTGRHKAVTLMYGNTATQRKDAINHLLTFDKSILDVGCGDGAYAIPFAKKIQSEFKYHAVDIDETLTDKITKKATRKHIDNIDVHNHLSEFLKLYDNTPIDVILTEVIEHMPIGQSRELISTILGEISFDKFIITVPNREFNQYYLLDDTFRHDDHDWEPNFTEFKELMDSINNNIFNIEFISIGDTIDGVSTSIGCVITHK